MKSSLRFTLEPGPFAAILAKYDYRPKIKDILAGKVIAIERKQALISLGLGNAGFLPKSEIFMDPSLCLKQYFQINYIGEFLILKIKEKKIIMSLRNLHHHRLWERLKQIDFSYMIFYTKTKKSTWGGKILNFDGLNLFAPNSHIPKYYRREQKNNRILPVKILKVKKKKNLKIICSSRFAFLKKQSSFLKVGMIHIGCVESIKRFGIFLSILSVKCLLHISEISDKRITNLKTLHKKGSRLKIIIIYINRKKGQIALSAKRF